MVTKPSSLLYLAPLEPIRQLAESSRPEGVTNGKGKGKTLNGLEFSQEMLTGGAEVDWEDGQLPKVQYSIKYYNHR